MKRKENLEGVKEGLNETTGNNLEDVQASNTDVANEPQIESVKDIAHIPEKAKAVLKCFTYVKEMYVDSKGGAFSKDTEKSLLGDAVLYENPYFEQ